MVTPWWCLKQIALLKGAVSMKHGYVSTHFKEVHINLSRQRHWQWNVTHIWTSCFETWKAFSQRRVTGCITSLSIEQNTQRKLLCLKYREIYFHPSMKKVLLLSWTHLTYQLHFIRLTICIFYHVNVTCIEFYSWTSACLDIQGKDQNCWRKL